MALAAGRLRHRVIVEAPTYSQDQQTGERTTTWQAFASDVPAAIEPLSAREFIAAQSMQSKVTARIVIRKLEGIRADMRIKHRGVIYNIEGILADPESGLEYMTLPVSAGVNQG